MLRSMHDLCPHHVLCLSACIIFCFHKLAWHCIWILFGILFWSHTIFFSGDNSFQLHLKQSELSVCLSACLPVCLCAFYYKSIKYSCFCYLESYWWYRKSKQLCWLCLWILVFVCVSVYVYVWVCVWKCVHMHMCLCLCVALDMHVSVCVRLCVHVCVRVCVCVCVCVCSQTYIFACVFVYIPPPPKKKKSEDIGKLRHSRCLSFCFSHFRVSSVPVRQLQEQPAWLFWVSMKMSSQALYTPLLLMLPMKFRVSAPLLGIMFLPF